jgi:hypothetical protein
MPKPAARNAVYAQSGGVTAVINASACGVIETALRYRAHIKRLYAGRDGIVGILTEDLIDVGAEDRRTIRALRHTPAGAFGSAHSVKLPSKPMSTVYWSSEPGSGSGLAMWDGGVVGVPWPSLQKMASPVPIITWLAPVPPMTA